MLGRTRAKTYGQLTRAELAQMFGHLRAAAAYAGAGASNAGAARLRGGWEAFAPLVETARIEAMRANRTAAKASRNRSRKGWMSRRWPLVVGALATTTAAAGAGTYAVRQWRESGATGVAQRPGESVPGMAAAGTGHGAAGEAGQGKDLWGTARQTVSGAARNLTGAAKNMSDKARTSGAGDRRASTSLEQTIG